MISQCFIQCKTYNILNYYELERLDLRIYYVLQNSPEVILIMTKFLHTITRLTFPITIVNVWLSFFVSFQLMQFGLITELCRAVYSIALD